jgi:hypothetical protein
MAVSICDIHSTIFKQIKRWRSKLIIVTDWKYLMYLITDWISDTCLLHFALVALRWDVWPLLTIQNSNSLTPKIPITTHKCTNAFSERYFWQWWNFTGHVILCTTHNWWQPTILHGVSTQKTTSQLLFFFNL